MKKPVCKPAYPENAYCAVYGKKKYPNMPADAEETLAHVMATLTEREADMFTLKFRDEMTYAEIGKRYGGLTAEKVRQIIDKAKRKLRHPSRSKILSRGKEAVLHENRAYSAPCG